MIHSRPGDDDCAPARPQRAISLARQTRTCPPSMQPADCATCPLAADCPGAVARA